MIWKFIHIADILLWLCMAFSVGYVVFFALISLIRSKNRSTNGHTLPKEATETDFLVIYPAYHEDIVIRNSITTFLKQDYPEGHFKLVVVSDNMQPETNQWLASQPLMLLQPSFPKSSKAKALQFAMNENKEWKSESNHRKVVILDADNVVAPDFLSRLNTLCQNTDAFIQCHRTAKNAGNDIAALDGVSEEINNTIFRRAHNAIGLSSALIGSGMCFDFQWFLTHVERLSTAVEDRELEAMIMLENIHIHYAEDIYVMDEKVSSGDNFQRQRLRWMTGQVQAFFSMLPQVPHALVKGNINYVDKVLQQALLPRSILLALLPVLCLVVTLLHWSWSIKWWILLLCFLAALFVAIPSRLRSQALLSHALALPTLVWHMLTNILRIKKKNTDFIHTHHQGEQ